MDPVANIRLHQLQLQAIADANDGTRASGTPGFDRSADYVANALEDAGYIVPNQFLPAFTTLGDTLREMANFRENQATRLHLPLR
jgi:Zn-dependent M28 family amino/carboxypeptidase